MRCGAAHTHSLSHGDVFQVAAYCALRLPDFIKDNQAFRDGHYEKALEECFISFDSKIIERSVVEELKKLAGCQEAEEEEEQEQDTTNEVSNLCEEASMPIEAVIAKLAGGEVGGPEGQGAGSAPMNPALRKLKEKEQKPVSPFLRAKPSPLGEQGGSNNKHIHFNEDGSEDTTKEEIKTEEDDLTSTNEASPATPVNGEVTGEEASESVENSPEGSEKENKDTNGAQPGVAVNGGEVTDAEGNLIKGKGKGKGKGKSRGKSEDGAGLLPEKKKPKKSATEIYETMLKTSPEDGDEESEDSEDEEFGEGLEEADSDEDGEEDAEDEEDSEDESEEDDEEGEEEEEDEEDVPEAEFTEEPGNDSGCTAVVALLAGTKLYVANAGDSR